MNNNTIHPVKRGFTGESNVGLIELLAPTVAARESDIVKGMWGTTVLEKWDGFVIAHGDFNHAVYEASTPMIVKLRLTTRDNLIKTAIELIDDAEDKAKGDLVMLATLGLAFKKASIKNNSKLLPPKNARMVHTKSSGSVQARCQAEPRSIRTIVQYQLPNGDWSKEYSFTDGRDMVIHGLVPGQSYTFRMQFDSRNGKSDFVECSPIICL